jgi:hypothetical protein
MTIRQFMLLTPQKFYYGECTIVSYQFMHCKLSLSMKQILSWEAVSHSACQRISSLLWKPKVQTMFSTDMDITQSYMNPVLIVLSYYLRSIIHFFSFYIYLYIYPWLYSPLLDLGRFFNFLFFYTVGRTPSQGRYLHTGQHKQTKRTQISMPQVRFEPMTPVFEWWKYVVHALDRAGTVIGPCTPITAKWKVQVRIQIYLFQNLKIICQY